MKYGVVVYKQTSNVGDDILSYAGLRYLPHVDYIIDREELDTFFPNKKEKVSVIMNGWYLTNKFNWPPSPYINPYIVGIHFSGKEIWGIGDEYLDGLGTGYLKKYGPIGCRDEFTHSKLENRGISSYFSGCLTLTIQKFENIKQEDKCILVDVPEVLVQKVRKDIGVNHVECLSHDIPSDERGKAWDIRCKYVEELLKKYQGARLVITTRLHCALPCLALGTPVILLSEQTEDFRERKNDFLRYIDSLSLKEIMTLNINDLFHNKNREAYIELRDKLIEGCQQFINKCQKDEETIDDLPDIEIFEKLFSDKIKWQKQLSHNRFVSLSQKEYDDLIDGKKWLEEQYKNGTRRIGELEKYIQELLNAKKWLETQNQIKADRIDELENWCKELETGKKWLEEKWKEAILKEN